MKKGGKAQTCEGSKGQSGERRWVGRVDVMVTLLEGLVREETGTGVWNHTHHRGHHSPPQSPGAISPQSQQYHIVDMVVPVEQYTHSHTLTHTCTPCGHIKDVYMYIHVQYVTGSGKDQPFGHFFQK